MSHGSHTWELVKFFRNQLRFVLVNGAIGEKFFVWKTHLHLIRFYAIEGGTSSNVSFPTMALNSALEAFLHLGSAIACEMVCGSRPRSTRLAA